MALIYSPTQVSAYMADPAEWRRVYLERVRPPPRPGHVIGAAVHRLLAGYLRGEVVIKPPGPALTWRGHCWYPHTIAFSGLHLLPPPGSVQVEVRHRFKVGGAQFVAIADAETAGLVLDHKLVENLAAMLTPEQLLTDCQAALLAHEHLVRTGLAGVTLRWIYYCRDGRQAEAVEAVATQELTELVVAKILDTCAKMDRERTDCLKTSKTSCGNSAARQTSLPIPT